MLKVLLFVLVFAVAVYVVARVIERRGVEKAPRSRQQPPRPLGPDDDPEFLRKLEQERRRRRRKDDPDPT